ncbi:MAG: hypothetical protein ABJL99_25625 [Aliishimia sp.]
MQIDSRGNRASDESRCYDDAIGKVESDVVGEIFVDEATGWFIFDFEQHVMWLADLVDKYRHLLSEVQHLAPY